MKNNVKSKSSVHKKNKRSANEIFYKPCLKEKSPDLPNHKLHHSESPTTNHLLYQHPLILFSVVTLKPTTALFSRQIQKEI